MDQASGKQCGSIPHTYNEVVIYHQSTLLWLANSLSKRQCHVLH